SPPSALQTSANERSSGGGSARVRHPPAGRRVPDRLTRRTRVGAPALPVTTYHPTLRQPHRTVYLASAQQQGTPHCPFRPSRGEQRSPSAAPPRVAVTE